MGGKGTLAPELFRETSKAFRQAAASGVGDSGIKPGKDFLSQLGHSADVFSAFKTHSQQSAMVAALKDENGKLRSFSQFRKATEPITGKYNKAWLKTEYRTAISRAHHAANWQQYQDEKDVLPCLEWVESTAAVPGEDHRIFWGTIQPVDSPFWAQHSPGDRWNCQCSLEQTDKAPTHAVTNNPDGDNPAPGLDGHPAEPQLFAQSHPYYPKSCMACPFTTNKLAALYHSLADNKDCSNCEFVDKAITKCKVMEFEKVKVYENGGEILVNALVNKSDSDYNDLIDTAHYFARNGAKVELMPKMSRPAKFEYDCVYGSFKGTKFYDKCPDFRINGKWFEEEGFISANPKKAFRNMLNDGLKQSNRLIISQPDLTDAYMKRVIVQRVKDGQNIKEIYVKNGKEFRLIYKKSEKP